MPVKLSIGIESLGEDNAILLLGLKKTLKPKCERIFKYFKTDQRIKILKISKVLVLTSKYPST